MWRVGTVVALHDETERRVELTVERLANGEVSPYLTRELKVGNQLELRRPTICGTRNALQIPASYSHR